MAPKRLRSYTAGFKLKVVERAQEIGNRATAREYEIDEKCVRRWVKDKNKLICMPKEKRANRTGTVLHPKLEEELSIWVKAQRDSGIPVSTVKIRLKAKLIASQMKLKNFTGSQSWCCRFLRRYGLSIRSKTTVGQSLPPDWEEKNAAFLQYVEDTIAEKGFNFEQIINMDEVPLSFDCPPNRTVHMKGEKTVSIRTTGHEKTSFTCVLACTASGEKLKPLIIFKRKTIPKEDFSKNIVIRVNEKGWMCETIMIDWLEEVWRKRRGAFFKSHGLLILDSMRAHLLDTVKSACKKASATLAVIPGGLTKKLQPLDLTVNKVFKAEMRNNWENWMTSGLHAYTKNGNMKRATYAEVSKWVENAWKSVKKETIVSGFRKAGILPKTDDLSDIEDDTADNDDAVDDLSNIADGTHGNDDEQGLDEQLMTLFNSDSENSEFDGFDY